MSRNDSPVLNAFTIDVEDWFHILDLRPSPPMEDWPKYESRVEQNTFRLLRLMREGGVKSTCFVLGWILEHYPRLCRELVDEGHEIASHGYAHELVYELTPEQFRADLEKSLSLTEEVCGVRPRGYRAPGFSITEKNLWAMDILAEMGFAYDSSLFPAQRGHGGMQGTLPYPHLQTLAGGQQMVEFPISITEVGGRSMAYCGGGYLRFFPYRFIRQQIRKANRRGIPVIVYIHPRDLDPLQPRLKMPLHRHFKSYFGLGTAESKIERLFQDFSFGTVQSVLEEQGLALN